MANILKHPKQKQAIIKSGEKNNKVNRNKKIMGQTSVDKMEQSYDDKDWHVKKQHTNTCNKNKIAYFT